MTMAFDAMSVSSRGATIATYELSASQVAASLSGAGLEASEIAAKLALMGYDKEAVVAALMTTGLTESQAEAAVAGLSFAAAEGTATAATNAFTTSLAMATKGLIAFLTTNPVGWAILAAGAIFGLVKLFDALTLSAEEATEQMEESVSAYEEATSQLKSLNNELQTTQDRIDELEAKDSLTFVEESELQKLRESVELLQIQADLAEKESVRKAKDAADDTVTAYRKNFKHDISADAVDEYISTSSSTGNNDGLLADESNVSAMLAAIEQFKRLRDELDKDSEYYADDYQHFQGIIDDTTDSLWDQVTVLSTYKSNLEAIPYDELSDEQKQALDEINTAIQLIYQSLDPSKWNEIQWEKISNSDQYKDAVKELTDISTETEITVDTIRSKFPELAQACEDAGVEIESVVNNLNGMRDVQDDTAESIGTYSAQLSDLTKVLSDLQSAYDLLETAQEEMAGGGGLSPDTIADLAEAEENYLDYLYEENGVVKLNTEAWKENADAKMQNEMAEIQKEIDSLEEQNAILEENIKFYKERQAAGNGAAWDNLIAEATADINENTVAIAENQGKLALYSSLYGSITGDLDAYTSALNNFSNIANTIDSVSGSFQTLADLQAQVANGFTMSLDKALEFAKVYPEILNNAQVSANGQITLNEGVVNSFIEGKKAELDAQVDAEIAKLEADKAVLTAKMEFSEAELELAKSVADGEGDITKELAEYRINAGNAVAQALIDAGIDEATAFKLAAAAMAQNAEEFDRVAMEVCTDVNGNFNKAAYDLAQTMYKNLTNVKTDLASVATQAHETAKAIAGVADGSVSGSSGVVGGSGGGVGGSGITLNLTSGSFQGTEYTYTAKESGLEDFISQIELDISNYQDAIAQIDGQIATLQALKNLPLKSFKSSGSGGSGSDSTASEVEEYTAAIDDYREAIERLNRIQTKRTDLETKLSNTNDLRTQIELQKELIGVYEEEQNALHDLNELRDQTIKDGTAALQQLGFDVEYDPDSNLFFVKNLEHLNELVADSKGEYNSLQEATNALRQDTENLINTLGDLNEANQENSESWLELAQAMKEARISIYENTRKESENKIKLSENWLNNAINRPVQVSIPVSVDKSELQELIDSYKEEIATAQELGIDLNKTIYGNIDTNNRQILEWTEENLNKYKDALASWDTTVDEMRGSFSTIFGSSSEYDGIEIAFSPILQTENGPVLLDSHTVDEYIYGLIDKAGEGWTNEKLLQLDTEGLEFDGQIIKNLLADIGDTAIQTGEAMHYVGDLGSISTAYKDIEDAAAAAKMSVDDLNRAIANGSVDNIGTTNVSYYYDVASIETHIAEIVGQYRKMQETIHEEAEYYRSLGYADTSDEVSELSDLWWDYYDKIAETAANAWQQVVDNANDALDRITGIYDTLKDAAQEYADSGFITIDTLQEICSWGVQYLAYLKDENGQLVINEDSIQKVIAARTEQMAVETALSYVQQIRSAIERNEISELMNLTMATEFTTNATWDLVYAQLKLLNVSGDLNDTMYAGALQNINNLRALSGIAITSIGKVEGSVKEANESAKKALQEQSDYLDDLLKYVMAMIKQEVKNQVEALENQIDKMKEIVDLQKKSLDLEREKDEYSKNVAEKTKELAKLQQQLALLELDDSRESLAKQAKLREEIADLSNDLADDQADHAYDAASDMLDDMADAYEKEKQKEIEVLENTISSEEKLYRLAIERIETQWDTLYQQLLDWNYEYGTVTNNEITAAWDAACIAVQQYGSYLNAILETQRQLAALEASSSSSSSSSTIIGGTGGTTGTNTTPNVIGNSGQYDTSGGQETENAHNIIKRMYANSQAWASSSPEKRTAMHEENKSLAAQLSRYGIIAVTDGSSWYVDRIGGALLYDKYRKYTYHTGGIAGDDSTLKQDELFAKLKKGEAVLTEAQQEPIYQALDFAETMLSRYGKLFSSMSDTDMIGGRMQEQIKQDTQQAQSAVQNSNMANEFNITLPVQVLQKLDDAEIQSLTNKISKYTINELDEVFGLRGKRSFRR